MNLSQQFSIVTLTVIQHLTLNEHQLDLEKSYRQITVFYRVATESTEQNVHILEPTCVRQLIHLMERWEWPTKPLICMSYVS